VPKTILPGKVTLDHGTFEANAVPDVFDARDLEYRSRLTPLPKSVDCRPGDRHVMEQEGNSCTGHAVAAMVNAVLSSQSDTTHVSPYMLYALARRYDEFEGETDVGSSLRGALKGWFYHGVLPDEKWPSLDLITEPDLDGDEVTAQLALERPLGSFYRVNATRLDDLQSAITELFAIVVSAAIHDGWYEPTAVTKTVGGVPQTMLVITRTASSQPVGGHAFCIVGYNDVGFLVQNSWGEKWGHQGFATLPYDDWLESGHDAWVARPGVPSVVSRRVRTKILNQPGGGLVEGPGPDLEQLSKHVVNLGDNGRLSQNGKFISTKVQIGKIFDNLEATQEAWGASPRRVVLYAHGGLDSEKTGLDIAQRQVNWWLSNKVYPITFAWQTGVTETLDDQLSDLVATKTPIGGLRFDLFEQSDRLIEKTAKRTLRWLWDEIKENAAAASDPLPDQWEDEPDDRLPGGSLIVARLRRYLDENPDVATEIHLVGHSAGSIFLTGLVEQLKAQNIGIESLTYLAAAIRTDAWVTTILPFLRQGQIKRFTAFGLNPTRELDDVCGTAGLAIYRKSLLYLVSRAFERPATSGVTQVPLVGMARFADELVEGTSLAQAVASLHDAALVWSPSATPADLRSDSTSHGGFDDDTPTMTSVLLRILRRETVQPGNEYVPNLPEGTSAAAVTAAATDVADQPPAIVTAELTEVERPLPQMSGQGAAASTVQARSALRRPRAPGSGSSGNRVLDALVGDGWEVRQPSPPTNGRGNA
jgi:Papain family cysteine protease